MAPRPKLHGTSSRAFRDYYRTAKDAERAKRYDEIRAEGQAARAKAKRTALTRDPKAVARMERARTQDPDVLKQHATMTGALAKNLGARRPRPRVGQFLGDSRVIKVHEDGSAQLANGMTVDAETGKIRKRIPVPRRSR